MNSKRQVLKEETWSRGTNSCLPFDVNVILNLSNGSQYTQERLVVYLLISVSACVPFGTQQDGGEKRTAKSLCVTSATELLLASFVVIFT